MSLHALPSGTQKHIGLNDADFMTAFERFQKLVIAYHGHPFTSFHDGLAAVWESYKPRLREHALDLLAARSWTASEIGSGKILEHTIRSIEIQDTRRNLTNNLVFWQNRFGHANRDHRAVLDAQGSAKTKLAIEDALFGLFCRDDDEGRLFERLADLCNRKYPLIAYLYFLKDMDRFMPIHPTGFDRLFASIGIDFVALRHCEWSNYSEFNLILNDVRSSLERTGKLAGTKLIDAHSFCWIFSTLLKYETEGSVSKSSSQRATGHVFGARERTIVDLRYSILQTVQQSRGQMVERTVQIKLKNLGMDEPALEAHLRDLMSLQDDRCALTGIPFQFKGEHTDSNLLPSPDRIDSSGHYAIGNIQIVCRFVNFWKSATPNNEFKRLLSLIRGVEELEEV